MKRSLDNRRRTLVERMREQMALKKLRAMARELGLPVEEYARRLEDELTRQEERDRLTGLSEGLAGRIVARMKDEPPAPAEVPGPPADLKALVDRLLRKDVP